MEVIEEWIRLWEEELEPADTNTASEADYASL
jgi:hypothetical protein